MTFIVPHTLSTEQRRAYLADMLRTNETYPCELRVRGFGTLTLETRTQLEDFVAPVETLAPTQE